MAKFIFSFADKSRSKHIRYRIHRRNCQCLICVS